MNASAGDRVAVVTGAGRGLGRQVALALARRGHPVVGVARHGAQLAETADLARADGGRMLTRPTDVSDPAAVTAMAAFVHEQLGAPAILVNAAGVFGPIALIRDGDPEDWVRTVMVDAIAPYLTVRAFIGGMLDAGWGRVVNVTSAASLHPPGALNSAYGTSKVALNQLTRHLAAEIEGSGVTANVIHPGDVKTDMWQDIRDRVAGMGPEAEPYRQWAVWVAETGGDPLHKAVDLVLRLTSDDGSDINGRFCWVDDPLQPPIPSWDEPAETQPWRR
ncbi:MAG: SDR family oxidoreductase [Chloroflexi bacterium]|nr:SDR family oxidoreductase [Chloroflexota bacterium]